MWFVGAFIRLAGGAWWKHQPVTAALRGPWWQLMPAHRFSCSTRLPENPRAGGVGCIGPVGRAPQAPGREWQVGSLLRALTCRAGQEAAPWAAAFLEHLPGALRSQVSEDPMASPRPGLCKAVGAALPRPWQTGPVRATACRWCSGWDGICLT